MKRYYYTIITILVFGLLSCSNEETKTQNQGQERPTIPITASEVKIGTQIWMTKNLNVSRYRNGDLIPQVTTQEWANLSSGAWCYYYNDAANGPIYGKLYNWYAVNDPRGLAPTGYHIPSEAEWITLTTFLGGDNVAGGKLKATILWSAPNTAATNSSGFTGFPGGRRDGNGIFSFNSYIGNWWTSSESGLSKALSRGMSYSHGAAGSSDFATKDYGYSVRCIKD